MIIGPRGEILAEQADGDLLIHELNGDDLRVARSEPEYLFRFRRPELYGPLAR
jgi:predicted amidohydrolase